MNFAAVNVRMARVVMQPGKHKPSKEHHREQRAPPVDYAVAMSVIDKTTRCISNKPACTVA